jgi:hypothetical protein
MAEIDPRLQELFAAMSNAGYDWIVSEILDGLRQGRTSLVTQAELEIVRSRIDQQIESPGDPAPEVDYEPIKGDDQITFAVDLVTGRFRHIKAMLDETEKNLKLISAKSDPPRAKPQLAFKVGDEVRPITSQVATELAQHIEGLTESISGWADSVRSKPSDQQ